MSNNTSNIEKKFVNIGALSFILSGIFFVLFPLARPFFDEKSLSEANNFASSIWPIAHSLGIFALILLPIGFFGAYSYFKNSGVENKVFYSFLLNWIGIGLTLPFFGAEAFSLPVIAQEAIDKNDSSILSLVNNVRFGFGIIFISVGLILVSISSIILAWAIWQSESISKWSGVTLAIGLVLFLPLLQGLPIFQIIRIIDGLIILAGGSWIAWEMVRTS